MEEAGKGEEEGEGGEFSSSSPSSPASALAASASSLKKVHLRVCLCPSSPDGLEYELQDAHDALVFWEAVRSLGGGEKTKPRRRLDGN